MAISADKITKYRNEGMSYALKIAREGGLEELEKQVRLRGKIGACMISKDELFQTMDDISTRVYNNTMTVWYAVFHDRLGFGGKRLNQLKDWFDQKVLVMATRSPMGHHWATFEDYAEEANRLYGLGIDIEQVRKTQEVNDRERVMVDAETMVDWLAKHGHPEAAEAVRKEVFEDGSAPNRTR